jgi:hypothetical protein
MNPLPWSYSALDTFKTCPRQYHWRYVLKNKEARSPQILWGEEVHKHFEDRQAVGKPLPDNLKDHEPFMQALEALPGNHNTEQKIALDVSRKPCNFFANDVWFRGVIDYIKIDLNNEASKATVVDYKTGKQHRKFDQLQLFALHTFALYTNVQIVEACFYWTQTKETTPMFYRRDDMKNLWRAFVPDLMQYAEAFETDIWQARKSGLCKAWCPVLECEFNGRRG